jgi:hypothetical protein
MKRYRRRVAARCGIRLVESRRRDERALEFVRYWPIDSRAGTVVARRDWGFNLDEIKEEVR